MSEGNESVIEVKSNLMWTAKIKSFLSVLEFSNAALSDSALKLVLPLVWVRDSEAGLREQTSMYGARASPIREFLETGRALSVRSAVTHKNASPSF